MTTADAVPGASCRVRVPATTANLGPGFDCLGLALNLMFAGGVVRALTTPLLFSAAPGGPGGVGEAVKAARHAKKGSGGDGCCDGCDCGDCCCDCGGLRLLG